MCSKFTCDVHFFTDKATHPTNRQEDWEYIIGFCDQINKELEGYVEITHKTFFSKNFH